MATVGTQLMTAEQFYDWCCRPEQEALNWELDRGQPVQMPFGSVKHGAVCANIVCVLGNLLFERRCPGYLCSNNTGVIVERSPDTVIGPDVAYYDKFKRLEELGWFFAVEPPRLAIEVLDSGHSNIQISRRVSCLLKCGAVAVWVVDSEEKTVLLHRAGENPVLRTTNDELSGGAALPEFRCRVADLFAFPGQ